MTTTDDDHRQPDHDQLLDLIRAAGRAPSAHNTQPWATRIRDGGVDLAVDPRRTLPAGDQTGRDTLLALGAWLECFTIVAATAGLRTMITILPAVEQVDQLELTGAPDFGRPVARVELVPGAAASPFSATDVAERAVFRGRLIPGPQLWDDLTDCDLPPWLQLRRLDSPAMHRLLRLGTGYLLSHPLVLSELIAWLRFTPADARTRRDGLDVRSLGLPTGVGRLLRSWLRHPARSRATLRLVTAIGTPLELFWRARTGDRPPDRAPVSNVAGVDHLVLIADPRLASESAGSDASTGSAGPAGSAQPAGSARPAGSAGSTSPAGIGAAALIEAGRALLRCWLHAHRHGQRVAPHSEIIDAPFAAAALHARLGLSRSQLPLAVFSSGHPDGTSPRSHRLTDTP
ncbi:hypothetical protein [Microlunatus speluncae]|uniref:hypothetical protein n=1 Tax=Microlunatus speluncae TaxID=2594267 RepID=UPI001266284B|nr:hypothetical protein [Microlunatus speluncae]